MPEPQKVVHLTAAQMQRKRFRHPLMDNPPLLLTAEHLNQLLTTYFETDKDSDRHVETRQELIINYFRLLGSVVARYLYHWPVSRRFLDEMVSTGVETITSIITSLTPGRLTSGDQFRSLGGLIEGRLRYAIEDTINELRGIAPAPRTTNRDKERAGGTPVYGTVEADLTSDEVKNSQAYVDDASLVFELKDALNKIAETTFEKQILMGENWGLSSVDVAKRLNTSPQWVAKVRSRLCERYTKLVRRSF